MFSTSHCRPLTSDLEYYCPVVRYCEWDHYSPQETQFLATKLSYTDLTWNFVNANFNELEFIDFSSLTPSQQNAYAEMGYDYDRHDCCNGHYYSYDWIDFDNDGYEDVLAALQTMGYNENTWMNDLTIPAYNFFWNDLSPEIREAAEYLCYSKETWDVIYLPWPEVVTYPGSFEKTSSPTSFPTTSSPSVPVTGQPTITFSPTNGESEFHNSTNSPTAFDTANFTTEVPTISPFLKPSKDPSTNLPTTSSPTTSEQPSLNVTTADPTNSPVFGVVETPIPTEAIPSPVSLPSTATPTETPAAPSTTSPTNAYGLPGCTSVRPDIERFRTVFVPKIMMMGELVEASWAAALCCVYTSVQVIDSTAPRGRLLDYDRISSYRVVANDFEELATTFMNDICATSLGAEECLAQAECIAAALPNYENPVV